jgi:hypothetical protein
MRTKVTQTGTIAGMTGLIGVLPTLATLGIAQHFEVLGAISLTIIHVCLMAGGVWIFTLVFGD